MRTAMDNLLTIIQTDPLMIHFCLHNPQKSAEPDYVPRLLGPLGFFIRIQVTDEEEQTVYRSTIPKVNLKLHPSKPESYQLLEPGYTYGIVLAVEDVRLDPGNYRLHLTYSNLEFRGFPGYSLGELKFANTLAFDVA
jgi:hypothetical protein